MSLSNGSACPRGFFLLFGDAPLLRVLVSLSGGLAVPRRDLGVVLIYSYTVVIQEAEALERGM
ncbi:MAG: hypothetical protein LBD04_05665 [Synergistaceae bacterium]|jgi:hypothetical protein|nr:hypothetical protein [Synergistaceae bacterium]